LPPCKTTNQAVIPFYAAPGSGYASHHSYPGGLATHVAVNVKAAIGFFNAYKDIYSFPMSRDIVIAAQTLHDLHKPWVFQWQENGSSRTEYQIAGTGAHHILTIAELIHREMPAELIVAMACSPMTVEGETVLVDTVKSIITL
jgi:23S rRNA maturation-related 3'-5' exoribonuclease YhaM